MRLVATCALIFFFMGCANDDAPTSKTRNTPMDTSPLIAAIDAGLDDAAIAAAKSVGAGGYDAVTGIVQNKAHAQRGLAFRCLSEMDAARAARDAAKFLLDPDDEVSAQALRALHRQPPSGAEADLLRAFNRLDENILRSEVALIMGRTPDARIASLKPLWEQTDDPTAKLGLTLALARRGDADARGAFAQQLTQAEGKEAYDLIQRCAYLEDRWIVPSLLEMLDHTELALHLAPDFKDPLPFRVADAALEALVATAKLTVDFECPRPRAYTNTEIEKVRSAASR